MPKAIRATVRQIEAFTRTAKAAVLASGKVLLAFHLGRRTDRDVAKGPRASRDIQTAADLASAAALVRVIGRACPGHDLLVEEEQHRLESGARFAWHLDSLDGTVFHRKGSALFGTMAALEDRMYGELLAAAIYLPCTGELVWAGLGRGAWRANTLHGRKGRARASRTSRLGEAVVAIHSSKPPARRREGGRVYARAIAICRECCRAGSAVDYAQLACGQVDAVLANGRNAWDHAAGALLVREAGGRFTDWDNRTWRPGAKHILASNGTALHAELRKKILRRK